MGQNCAVSDIDSRFEIVSNTSHPDNKYFDAVSRSFCCSPKSDGTNPGYMRDYEIRNQQNSPKKMSA